MALMRFFSIMVYTLHKSEPLKIYVQNTDGRIVNFTISIFVNRKEHLCLCFSHIIDISAIYGLSLIYE